MESVEKRALKYQEYVYKIARGIYAKYSRCIELNDLIQYGQIGLVEALNNYDECRGVAFEIYACRRIKGAIYDGLKNFTELANSRSYRSKLKKTLEELIRANNCGNNENSAVSKIENLKRILKLITQAYILSLDAISEASIDNNPEQLCINAQLKERLQKALAKLSPKEYLIIKYCYYEDMSIASAGAKIGICRSWALRLHNKALNSLYEALSKNNIQRQKEA